MARRRNALLVVDEKTIGFLYTFFAVVEIALNENRAKNVDGCHNYLLYQGKEKYIEHYDWKTRISPRSPEHILFDGL